MFYNLRSSTMGIHVLALDVDPYGFSPTMANCALHLLNEYGDVYPDVQAELQYSEHGSFLSGEWQLQPAHAFRVCARNNAGLVNANLNTARLFSLMRCALPATGTGCECGADKVRAHDKDVVLAHFSWCPRAGARV